MSKDEFEALFDGLNPIKLLDNHMALIIRFFYDDGTVGVQVPGEDQIRWLMLDRNRTQWRR